MNKLYIVYNMKQILGIFIDKEKAYNLADNYIGYCYIQEVNTDIIKR